MRTKMLKKIKHQKIYIYQHIIQANKLHITDEEVRVKGERGRDKAHTK